MSLLSDRSIAFIKFLKVRSAKKAIHDLNKVFDDIVEFNVIE